MGMRGDARAVLIVAACAALLLAVAFVTSAGGLEGRSGGAGLPALPADATDIEGAAVDYVSGMRAAQAPAVASALASAH